MKLRDLVPSDTERLPQLGVDQVLFLWFDDFYDGPIRGMAEVDGERLLFDLIDQNVLGTEKDDRDYWLIKLMPDQLADEESWHALFCQNVGTHFDYTGRPPLPDEQVNMDAFYVPFQSRTVPDYGDNEVIGWFALR